MEFDKTKVYTALNADESLIGAKGYFADNLEQLKMFVEECVTHEYPTVYRIDDIGIMEEDYPMHRHNFFYLVEPAPEKWYVHKTIDDEYSISEHYFCSEFEGTKEECEKYISEHSKPKCRPFKDCDELIETYKSKLNGYYNVAECPLDLPTIWVKNDDGHRFLISYFGKDNVIADGNVDMDILFEEYSFLDGSVCGVEE